MYHVSYAYYNRTLSYKLSLSNITAPVDIAYVPDYDSDMFKKDGEICDHSSECEHELECIKKHMNDVARCDCNLNDFYLVNGSCFAG